MQRKGRFLSERKKKVMTRKNHFFNKLKQQEESGMLLYRSKRKTSYGKEMEPEKDWRLYKIPEEVSIVIHRNVLTHS